MLRNRIANKRINAAMLNFLPTADTPDTFNATSGDSRTEIAAWPWLPHHERPIVGFTPNR